MNEKYSRVVETNPQCVNDLRQFFKIIFHGAVVAWLDSRIYNHFPIFQRFFNLPSVGTKSAAQTARRLFLRQTRRHSQDLKVLRNAIYFCIQFNPATARRLLRKAELLEVNDEDCAQNLAHAYSLLGGKKAAQKAVQLGLRAYEIHKKKRSKKSYVAVFLVTILEDLANLALREKLLVEATALGNTLKKLQPSKRTVRAFDGVEIHVNR